MQSTPSHGRWCKELPQRLRRSRNGSWVYSRQHHQMITMARYTKGEEYLVLALFREHPELSSDKIAELYNSNPAVRTQRNPDGLFQKWVKLKTKYPSRATSISAAISNPVGTDRDIFTWLDVCTAPTVSPLQVTNFYL